MKSWGEDRTEGDNCADPVGPVSKMSPVGAVIRTFDTSGAKTPLHCPEMDSHNWWRRSQRRIVERDPVTLFGAFGPVDLHTRPDSSNNRAIRNYW